MADDKTKSDKRDITQVAADEVVEVDYFAKRHGITPDLVRELIKEYGNDCAKLEEEAAKISGGGPA